LVARNAELFQHGRQQRLADLAVLHCRPVFPEIDFAMRALALVGFDDQFPTMGLSLLACIADELVTSHGDDIVQESTKGSECAF